jgi:hypothetical protein
MCWQVKLLVKSIEQFLGIKAAVGILEKVVKVQISIQIRIAAYSVFVDSMRERQKRESCRHGKLQILILRGVRKHR